jgi:hypothetical protein
MTKVLRRIKRHRRNHHRVSPADLGLTAVPA